MSGFEFTPDMLEANLIATASTAGVSLFLCVLILLAALVIHLHPGAKRHLDRISFRLLLWSVGWEIVYDVTYIFLYGAPDFAAYVQTTQMCPAGVYFMVSAMGVVNWLCTCIAINLLLTITFGINPIQRRLERWYVLGSMFLGLFVPLIPTALGHFGPDPDYGVCYFTSSDDDTRILHFVVDVYAWQILSCIISAGAVAMTLYTIFHHGRATSRALIAGHALNLSMQDPSADEKAALTRSVVVSEPKQRWWRAIFTNPLSVRSRKARRARRDSQSTMGHLQERFLAIALKISLYPLSMIIVNGVITVGDLYFSTSPVTTEAEYGLYIIYGAFYSGRGIVFCFLGLFVDPCLRKGVKAVWRSRRQGASSTVHGHTSNTRDQSFAEFLSFPAGPDDEGNDLDAPTRRASTASLNVTDALRRLPYDHPTVPGSDRPVALPPIPEISGSRLAVRVEEPSQARSMPASGNSKSFAGVSTGSLPHGLTDEVDVDLRLGTANVDAEVQILAEGEEKEGMDNVLVAAETDLERTSAEREGLRISIQDGPTPILVVGPAHVALERLSAQIGQAERGELDGANRARQRSARREAQKMFEEVEARL